MLRSANDKRNTVVFTAKPSSFLAIINYVRNVAGSLWWGIVPLTTVGYGAMVPSNYVGKVVGVFCAVWGIITLATSVPIIVSNFQGIYSSTRGENGDIQRKQIPVSPTQEYDNRHANDGERGVHSTVI